MSLFLTLNCKKTSNSKSQQNKTHIYYSNSPPVLQYMQFVEDYSEPQPSMFYQMPQSESIYEQRNKRFQEVYGFNDSFSSTDSVHEPVLPPALPPKQRQLVRNLPDVCKRDDNQMLLRCAVAYALPRLSRIGLSYEGKNGLLV